MGSEGMRLQSWASVRACASRKGGGTGRQQGWLEGASVTECSVSLHGPDEGFFNEYSLLSGKSSNVRTCLLIVFKNASSMKAGDFPTPKTYLSLPNFSFGIKHKKIYFP